MPTYGSTQSVGPRYPTAATGTGVDRPWTNLSNIYLDDSTDASSDPNAAGVKSNVVIATGYGFSIPSNALVVGMEITVKAKGSTALRVYGFRPVKAGAVAGTAKDGGGETSLAAGYAYLTKGSNSDLWGTTLTPSDVNASNFGASFYLYGYGGGGTGYVDVLSVTIYYQVPLPIVVAVAQVAEAETVTAIAKTLKIHAVGQASNPETASAITIVQRYVTRIAVAEIQETDAINALSLLKTYQISSRENDKANEIWPLHRYSPEVPEYPVATFADRLYDQLMPFAQLDNPDLEGRRHLRILCDAIGEMFREVEELTADRTDGLAGYANLLDVDSIRGDWIGFLSQFVGVRLLRGFSTDQARDMIRGRTGFNRGRRDSIRKAAAATLIGTQAVFLQERASGSAWRWRVITRLSETPNPDLTRVAILTQKPAYDIVEYEALDTITWEWIKDNYATWTAMKFDNPTWEALAEKEI